MDDRRLERHLDELVVQVASGLMPVSAATHLVALKETMRVLADFLNADAVFLRRNDHAAGNSILMAEWPLRSGVTYPDPLGVVPFDADPIFASSRTLSEPLVTTVNGPQRYRQRVREASGQHEISMACVPLLNGAVTEGVLGFVNFGVRTWDHQEINALRAISSMLVQLNHRVGAEERLQFAALHDELTGLPNRRALSEELERRLARTGSSVAVLFVDLDRFKVMNDFLGHGAGDQLLSAVGERLRVAVRGTDFVGRLGGDEFLVLSDISGSVEEAVGTADRLIALIARPIEVDGQFVSHTASVGIALPVPGAGTARDMLRMADVALYEAKASGRNRTVVFDAALETAVAGRSNMELHLRRAIEAKESIELHYQPEVDMRSGRILGVEALVRWRHPVRGLLAAAEFISLAEETGLIVDLGAWVLVEACRQIDQWRRALPDAGLLMRVNVSPLQLKAPGLVDFVAGCLSANSLAPSSLCLEITEHAVLKQGDSGIRVLEQLLDLGIAVAIDDFGTGYSSLAQLKWLPVGVLKIDRSFVAEVTSSAMDRAVIEAIVGLGAAFGLDLVAEGIEEAAVARELLRLGCRRGQGYLFARPAPAHIIEPLLRRGRVDFDVSVGAGESSWAAAASSPGR